MAKKSAKAAVEIVVIADRSGSMSSIRTDAIGGFNTFLAEQQKVKGAANLTLILFDDQYEVPIESKPIADVPPLTEATFVPRGMTAMNDAIGRALTKLETAKPEKAIVCILTDGQENASKEFTAAQVKSLITAADARGWQVVYLAANQDAFSVGATLGIQGSNTQNFAATGKGVQDAYTSLSVRSTNYRSA